MDRLDADGFMRCLLAAHAAEDAFAALPGEEDTGSPHSPAPERPAT